MSTAERREREKQKRRNEILRAAETLFHSNGYDSTTMADIAQSVDLSAGTLYLYFPNKEVLHAAVSLKILHNLLKNIEKKVNDDQQDPTDTLLALKEVIYRFYQHDKSILLNVFRFQASPLIRELPDEMVDYLKDLARPSMKAIANTVKRGINKGAFKLCNPVAAADIIWGVFSGLVIFEESKRALDPRKDFMKETLDLAFSFIVDGLKNKE
jgi:AcrR family transcriptional regulator